MTRRHYRYRPTVYASPGCVGCSVPILLLLGALGWALLVAIVWAMAGPG